MQIIIPMSGFGERFRSSGYDIPKPLIEVDGKPIIEHVVEMFPGSTNFIFICNEDHLNQSQYKMKKILNTCCPNGKIVGIKAHKKGPVHAVLQAKKFIDCSEPSIVNYCDFACYWDWDHFQEFVKESDIHGAIPAYKGFHPHSLGDTKYAYVKEDSGLVLDIQEKKSFTQNSMNEYASSGTYFFKSGKLMIDCFEETIKKNINIAGEYYVSLAYKTLLEDGKKIGVYPLQHFMQWGTPDDLEEYQQWSNIFSSLISHNHQNNSFKSILIVPMAGLGKRFSNEGYKLPKPLIPVSGSPMSLQAIKDLPSSSENIFLLRKDLDMLDEIEQQLLTIKPNATIMKLEGPSDGQASSAMYGINAIQNKDIPLTIGACDNGMLYNQKKLLDLMDNHDVDIIVWAIKGHKNAANNPKMYGWINSDHHGKINSVSVKTPIGNIKTDPIITGTFTFKKQYYFSDSVKAMKARTGKINNEYYIDECINDAISNGLNCYIFEIEHFLCWGTPVELMIYEYWQSCFHKWSSHPYSLADDPRVLLNNFDELNDRFKKITPQALIGN
jgi:NDP-sugar pyrophosphorylase family protein